MSEKPASDQPAKGATVGVGYVTIGDLAITVAPLSQAEELALDHELRAEATKQAGDRFTRCKPELDAMKDFPAERLEFVREIARASMAKLPLSEAAVYEYRTSAEGVALELYTRGRKATPGLELKALRTIITEVNARQVFAAMMELVGRPEEEAAGG